MNPSTISILFTLMLLSVSLAGCSKTDDKPLVVFVANETEYDLQTIFMQGESGGGSLGLGAGERSGTNFGCPEDNLGPEWQFTLQVRHKEGPAIGPVFAEATYTVSCDYYTAWVHPDGFIVWEDGDRGDDAPPWTR